MKIHMLGIKGTGMSALALVLKGLGNIVTGSDIDKYLFTEEELLKQNIAIKNFSASNLEGIDLLIVGHNFINSDNCELVEAKKRKIPFYEYNRYLAELIKKYYSIAICGSNGKSTVTALLSSIFSQVENCSYLIGSGEGNGNSDSKYFIFEACEHKEHFLAYKPDLILVNNIDYDHVDYYKREEDYKNAFFKFIEQAKDKIVVNGDDHNLKNIKNSIVFGIENRAMFNARNISYDKGIKYDLYYQNMFIKRIELELYGEYMVYDTLAAISVAMSLGIEIDLIIKGLKNFNGVKRRFRETIVNDDVYIDDYAHHPSKIKAIIEAVRSKYKDKRVIAFYRPDRIPRLDYFSKEFAKSLKLADKAFILPFIADNEENNAAIARFLENNPKVKLATESVYKKVSKESGVIYLMMSSKDMSEVKEKILKYKGD